MARKRQTTGLPKAKAETSDRPETSSTQGRGSALSAREFRSRAEREAEIQRYVIIGTVAAIALTIVVLGIALVIDQFITPRRTVATVNGESISVAEFEERVRFERILNSEKLSTGINDVMEQFGVPFEDAANQAITIDPYRTYWDELNIPDQMGLRVLNEMIDDRLIRQEAENRGITVTEEDIQRQIEKIFNYDRDLVAELEAETTPEPTAEPTATATPLVSPTPSPVPSLTSTPETAPTATLTPFPTVAPTPTQSAAERREAFSETNDDFYSLARREAGMSRDEVNEYFETQAIREALSKAVLETGDTEVWVNSRHILVETEEEALEIINALNAGESFADLAAAKGTDGTASNGGELGWSALSGYVEEFADALRDAPVGEILGPIQTEFGYHVVQIRAREDREADEDQLDLNRQQEFGEWVNTLREQEGTEFELSDIWPDHVPNEPPWQYRPRE